jgi:hypothetical protein
MCPRLNSLEFPAAAVARGVSGAEGALKRSDSSPGFVASAARITDATPAAAS